MLTHRSPTAVFQLLSGALSVAAAQSVFINRLLAAAAELVPDVSRAMIISTGATDLERVFTSEQLPAIRESYLTGLRAAWAMAIACAGVALLSGLTLGFKRIEQPPAQKGGATAAEASTTEEEATQTQTKPETEVSKEAEP